MKICPQCQHTYAGTNEFCPRDGTALTFSDGLQPGSVFCRKFRILEEVGRGGMGVVYRAQHLILNEERALKLINARYAENPQAVQRFLSEALLANQVVHPNVAAIYDADQTDEGQPYVVMEYVRGTSLKHVLKPHGAAESQPLNPDRAADIAIQVCGALAAAHAKGIIHRDIKPDNILITSRADGGDVVKVVDFGLAKAKKELYGETAGESLTQSGIFVGTPQYCSPEQARGSKGDLLDHRTDIYSLGVVLYEMLAGRPPFSGDLENVLHQHRLTPPPLPSVLRPELQANGGLVDIVMKALRKDSAERFASVEQMQVALEEVRGPEEAGSTIDRTVVKAATETPAPTPATPRSSRKLAIVMMLIAAVLVTGGYALWNSGKTPKPQQPQQTVSREVKTQPDNSVPIREAETMIAKGEYDAAIRILEDVLRNDSANASARQMLDTAKSAKAAEERVFRGKP